MSEAAIKYRLRKGLWLPASRGLYRVDGVSGDYQGLLRGATAILPDATVSYQSAAEIHQMAHVRRGKAVVTVHAGTTHQFPGVTIHRSIDLFSHHRLMCAGMLTTSPARTLVDLPAVPKPEHMARVLDEALASGIVTIDEVEMIFIEVARRGRDGSALMGALLNERVVLISSPPRGWNGLVCNYSRTVGCPNRSFNIQHRGIRCAESISPGRSTSLVASAIAALAHSCRRFSERPLPGQPCPQPQLANLSLHLGGLSPAPRTRCGAVADGAGGVIDRSVGWQGYTVSPRTLGSQLEQRGRQAAPVLQSERVVGAQQVEEVDHRQASGLFFLSAGLNRPQ